MRFHTETYLDPADIQQPLTVFLEWVKTLIPKDKFNIFVSLFKFPTPIIELTGKAFNELERVFDGRNPAINFQFKDTTLRDDWEYYRQEVLNEPHVWRHKGYEALKTAVNSVLIVDLPQEQGAGRPEPYFYFLRVENIRDFETKDGVFQWILFNQPNNQVAIFDDEYYRVIQLTKNGQFQSLIKEDKHELGYCPAAWFWSESLSAKTPDLKKNPITPQLSNLDWLLFFATSKKHLDLYAPYPIYSAYEADCAFANNETGDYCDGGFLRNVKGDYKALRNGTVEKCPVCSEKRIAGVGSFIEIPVPTEGSPDMKNPVQITTIDKESLDFNVSEEKRLKDNIYQSIVGTGGESQTKEAINEMQVSASFESKSSILNNLKGNFERAQKFIDDTICRLRYGDSFLSSSISMGTEFYIYTVDDLYRQYKMAKDNGASEAQMDAINQQIIETENRNNPMQLQRMIILKQLEPYRHYTRSELITMHDKELIDPDLMRIKINFNSFVERFERENMNLIEFGSQLQFDKKVKIILNKFREYGKEQSNPVQRPDGGAES